MTLKNDVNVPSNRYKEKKLEKKNFFADVGKVTDEKNMI
jgi:hypothetical protein